MLKGVNMSNSGDRFNRVILINRVENGSGYDQRWLCKCDCGKTKVIRLANLKNGHAKSCGCLDRELKSKRFFKHGHSHSGKNGNPSIYYKLWNCMLTRCENKNVKYYHIYGGRGITVAPEFHDSSTFIKYILENLGPRPSDKHSIDRINNDGNYEPGNLRWATAKEQSNNKRQANQYTK
jgi:hypothetical protein